MKDENIKKLKEIYLAAVKMSEDEIEDLLSQRRRN